MSAWTWTRENGRARVSFSFRFSSNYYIIVFAQQKISAVLTNNLYFAGGGWRARCTDPTQLDSGKMLFRLKQIASKIEFSQFFYGFAIVDRYLANAMYWNCLFDEFENNFSNLLSLMVVNHLIKCQFRRRFVSRCRTSCNCSKLWDVKVVRNSNGIVNDSHLNCISRSRRRMQKVFVRCAMGDCMYEKLWANSRLKYRFALICRTSSRLLISINHMVFISFYEKRFPPYRKTIGHWSNTT